MKIVYIDIDSLRPDHLGCYGYHRPTSPNIDRLAAQGWRFANCHASDVPCLPSRTALFSGRTGYHTGVINHGGVASQPRPEGPARGFRDSFCRTSWPAVLRERGYYTATVSPFGERHSAWHWFAGFNEILNPAGRSGMESADEIFPAVAGWLRREAARENFFLHSNLWDPHTPYRAPAAMGNPFASSPSPAWLTEAVRASHWSACGPHSAQEVLGFCHPPLQPPNPADYPRQPLQMRSVSDVRAMFDGYDCGVLQADACIGRVLEVLDECGVLAETAVIVSSDHGENLGELNIYGDHQTADQITTRVPLIVRWPGITEPLAGRVENGLIYHFDFAATLVEMAGGRVPDNWDGQSFARALSSGPAPGRDTLVLSQAAWSCQRGVRWNDWLYLHSYHDGFHGFPADLLFDVRLDPHEQHDLASARPEVVAQGRNRLAAWLDEQRHSAGPVEDPMQTVLAEGGPYHCRGELPAYLDRLRNTGRAAWADRLAARHHGQP